MDSGDIKKAIDALSPDERRELLAWMKDQERPVRSTPSRRVRAKAEQVRPPGLLRGVAGTLIGLVLFACVESAIFRSGWYDKYLEPDSMAGQVEYRLFWLLRTRPAKVPDVLVIGDSRIDEGFSAPAASAAVGGKVHFISFGMPGSTPRVWYYTLLATEKDRTRFSAIVIPFDHYSDFESGEDLQNRITDLNFLAGRLRWSDCLDFSRSFTKAEMRRDALTGCLFRGLVLRPDLLEFLSNIPLRLNRTRIWRNKGAGYIARYGGSTEDMQGLTFDASTRTIHFPARLGQQQIDDTRATLTPWVVPQTGALTDYRRRWMSEILDLYKNSATQIIFIQLPNAPLPLPDAAVPARFIDSVKARPRLTVVPADTFRHLQRPELFADGLHLNHTGRQLFSAELAKAVAPVVEGH